MTKEEFTALPQRDKEAYFPVQPNLPPNSQENSGQMFGLLSDANDTYEQQLIALDTPGLPIGAKDGDFENFADADVYSDDAVIITEEGKQVS